MRPHTASSPIIKYHNKKEDFHVYQDATFVSRALAFVIDSSVIGLLQAAAFLFLTT